MGNINQELVWFSGQGHAGPLTYHTGKLHPGFFVDVLLTNNRNNPLFVVLMLYNCSISLQIVVACPVVCYPTGLNRATVCWYGVQCSEFTVYSYDLDQKGFIDLTPSLQGAGVNICLNCILNWIQLSGSQDPGMETVFTRSMSKGSNHDKAFPLSVPMGLHTYLRWAGRRSKSIGT